MLDVSEEHQKLGRQTDVLLQFVSSMSVLQFRVSAVYSRPPISLAQMNICLGSQVCPARSVFILQPTLLSVNLNNGSSRNENAQLKLDIQVLNVQQNMLR